MAGVAGHRGSGLRRDACKISSADLGWLEDALYDSQALRGFAGIALNRDPVPDATTVLHFRHWLERHDLTEGCSTKSVKDGRWHALTEQLHKVK